MEYLILWAVGSIIVGWMGDGTTLGFGSAFLISVIFSPVIGFIIVLLYPSKSHRDKRLLEQKRQNEILQNISTRKISDADEIEKLKTQMDKGIITQEEFQQLKNKIISS